VFKVAQFLNRPNFLAEGFDIVKKSFLIDWVHKFASPVYGVSDWIESM
jgi:hypothetical protein